MSTFSDFGLLATLQKTLKEKNLKKPTEIQSKILPLMLGGDSVVGIAETGSGKTLAYALPLLHLLKTKEIQGDAVQSESSPRGLVLVPTRELGDQIAKVFKLFTHETRLRVRSALGGVPLAQARKSIVGEFEILIATPGRLAELMKQKAVHLDHVEVLIFDEADQMMDDTFKSDSHKIAEACPDDLLLGLFSATVNPAVEELMDNLFAKANVIFTSGSGKTVKTLTTRNLKVENGERWPVLEKVLNQPMEGGTILFTNTREQCDKIAKQLEEAGYTFGLYRGDMDKAERRKIFEKFRNGIIDLLISTDLASRGLDIESVDRVINYHMPKDLSNYIHRVGRTARAGRKGLVVNLITERDDKVVAKIEKLLS